MLKIRAIGFLIAWAVGPVTAYADFCDTLASGAPEQCRSKVRANGSVIIGNWLRLKPEQATQPGTGTRGYFVSGTTPAISILGTSASRRLMLTLDCFAGKRSVRLDAMPYMLGLANGSNKTFDLSFIIDAKPAFREKWPLDWQHAELKAPQGSRLATELQRSAKLTVKTEGIIGRESPVGYVFDTRGFDQMNSGLCR